jgi:hypothetical protein
LADIKNDVTNDSLTIIKSSFHGAGCVLLCFHYRSLLSIVVTNLQQIYKTIYKLLSVIQVMKRYVMRYTGSALNPHQVVCDFELSIMTAVQTEFVNAEICGCFFHFTQSLWRRVQNLGLAGPYSSNDRLRTAIRKIMCSAFIPVALLRNNLNILWRSNDWQYVCGRYPAGEGNEASF